MRQNEHDDKDGFSSSEASEALRSLKNLKTESPSPFFKTRILAHTKAIKKSRFELFKENLLQPLLAVTFLFTISIFIFQKTKLNNPDIDSYKTGQAYVIRMDIRPYKELGIAYAEVLLENENIQFSSSRFEKISQQKKLTVSWESVVEKQFLPIVIKGMKSGSSKVIVNFYDSENNLVNTKNVNLEFKGG